MSDEDIRRPRRSEPAGGAGPARGQAYADRYQALFESAADGILIVDEAGVIRDANRQAHRMFGYRGGELVGQPVEALVPEGARGRHGAHREGFMEDVRARPMGIGLELSGRRCDGSIFPVEISLSPLRSDGGLRVVAIVRDMTERNRLREFGVTALRAAEEERQRIARELHDDTAQRLGALLLRLRLVERAEDGARRRRLLEEARRELQETAEGVRRIARGLRPPVLADAGVVSAIQAHVWALLESTDLRAEVDTASVDDLLSADSKLVLYRIVQEALSNVVRHGDAARVRVRVAREEGAVVGVVQDDGRGFDVAAALLEGEGLGLLGMRERAAAVGGRVEVESRPGRGTRVVVRIPSQEPEEKGDTDA